MLDGKVRGDRKVLEKVELEYVEKHQYREREKLAVIGPILLSSLKF